MTIESLLEQSHWNQRPLLKKLSKTVAGAALNVRIRRRFMRGAGIEPFIRLLKNASLLGFEEMDGWMN
jgi:hypothetical protein